MTSDPFRIKNHHGVAFILDDGSEVTYPQLSRLVGDISRCLVPRKIVFLLAKNDLESILVYLACLNVGAVPLLISADIADEYAARLIEIYDPLMIFLPIKNNLLIGKTKLKLEIQPYGLFQREEAVDSMAHKDLQLLLTTSGSTGSPKMVRISKKNLLSNCIAIVDALKISSDDRAITSLPWIYSYGLSVINSHLYCGASIMLTSKSMIDRNFWSLVNNFQITSIAGVPFSYDMLLRLGFEEMNIPSMRKMTQAGGKMNIQRLSKLSQICRTKNISLIAMYGQTEATARISILDITHTEAKIGSIGRPIPGGALWIEDEEGGITESVGVIGELVYKGPNVCMGYASNKNDTELGDINFDILRTGDLAFRDSDNYFYVVGRKKRIIKIAGLRISLDEIEAQIGALGFECAAVESGDSILIALEGVTETGIEEVKKILKKMAISNIYIKYLILNSLPRFSSGKINYEQLKAFK